MLLHFSKMHGLGNDFVVIDLITQRFRIEPKHIRFLADRNFGIGCDQVLLVETPSRPEIDFKYRIFNADGSEVEQCGNGARCFAKFVRDKRLSGKQEIHVETSSGDISLKVQTDGQVSVNMGPAILNPEAIPFMADTIATTYQLEVLDQQIELGAISMGNPHGVVLVDDVTAAPVETLGPALECHARFPQKANIGFLQIVDENHAKLRVYERGVGETLACGTGACAAAVYGILREQLKSPVSIELPGGALNISWQGGNSPVIMTGPASNVFDGKIQLKH